MKTEFHLDNIIAQFDTSGSIASRQPFGSGHINDTYRLVNTEPDQPDYLLQRVNHLVFKDVPGLMQNINKVTAHLKVKLADTPGADPTRETMTLIPLKDGDLFHKDHAGNYWRMFHFLKDTRSYDLVTTARQAYEGGKAFGRFQFLLSDLDAEELIETIPGFHDMEMRLDQLQQAIDHNLAGRLADVAPELDFIEQRADAMCSILYFGRAGKLPQRITHNDTKFNNVLLDANDHAQCVVDLDTVMPGYIAYDFGDAIRTIINTAAEDEADLGKIQLNVPLFEAYTQGYFEQARAFITDEEVRSLMMGVLMLPFIQAVRFLTDHLNGDIYFKTHHANHNLQRARAQMQLVRKLEEAKEGLEGIVARYA